MYSGKSDSVSSSACKLTLSLICGLMIGSVEIRAQGLESKLLGESTKELVADAIREGDAARGAILFYQPAMACSQCHNSDDATRRVLGPNLSATGSTRKEGSLSDEQLIESILHPSKVIPDQYRSVIVATNDGETITGLLVAEESTKLQLREITPNGRIIEIEKDDIEATKPNPLSPMPAGLVNQLTSRQQFLDLVRYLIEIRDGGESRAKELKPAAALLAVRVPEYESHLDHEGLIRGWDSESLKRGEAIYARVCANCHGTVEQPGSLPTSLRFAEGKFKNGSDPYSMYRTLTHGFGFMMPQTWMVPSQKYDVIHYIRESYLKPHNASQFTEITEGYFAALPKGDTKGPEASQIDTWIAMDYGPSLTHTYEIPGDKDNFAYKGIAIRLDHGAGGVSRGKYWTIFDTDTLRVAATWSASPEKGSPFIDWRGIQFNGEHQIHPKIAGDIRFANETGPGWARPEDLKWADDERVLGRDNKRYGPLPRSWGRFKGLYYHDQDVLLSYEIGDSHVLEMPQVLEADNGEHEPWFIRHLEIGPRSSEMQLRLLDTPTTGSEQESAANWKIEDGDQLTATWIQNAAKDESEALADNSEKAVVFDRSQFLQIDDTSEIDMFGDDFTIAVRFRTKEDGTLVALCQSGPLWVPNGQAFFIRDGKLCFDIGWVGAIGSRKRVTDGNWHIALASWNKKSSQLQLILDGEVVGEGAIRANDKLVDSVLRIGFTSPNFPAPASMFQGDISEVRFYQCGLSKDWDWKQDASYREQLKGKWFTARSKDGIVSNLVQGGALAKVAADAGSKAKVSLPISLGVLGGNEKTKLLLRDGSMVLSIPAGPKPLRLAIWTRNVADSQAPTLIDGDINLSELTHGGQTRFPEKIETALQKGDEAGSFAVDTLLAPQGNPWLAQTRFTGLDFLPDGRMAVCTWDGDVWLVQCDEVNSKLTWKRIASGMFQPLGLKFVNGHIYLTCRDQLAKLHDLNGDEEIDFYECFNNDHQVTEHFHEFAMGLQVDREGNFYYAKSGRHALKAVIPHHGTLLRVTPDGSRTDILATGFRAANGVCLNPDGSFVVTDQEGFWNPKNRINWVTVPKDGTTNFYGNMFGYHDITDTSDDAMEPPLCWITNAFDRSPAELLWVESEKWGALNGSLLSLSYGYGRVFLVPHESVQGKMQGGMVSLPIPDFPTGVMRGRFKQDDGALYLCGMFAWAGNATEPGGLYRIRATGKPSGLPLQLHATTQGITLKFPEKLDKSVLDKERVRIKVWGLKRTANYGSNHINEHEVKVTGLRLEEDGQTLHIDVPAIAPTWCMEIQYKLKSAAGEDWHGTIHNTIHALGE